jgi:L-malate glycosyltransferase
MASALKIVHVDTGRSLRGGQRQLLALATGLRELGHNQVIACLAGSGLEVRLRKLDFDVFSLPRRDPGHLFGLMLGRERLKACPTQIIHAHDGRGQTLAWLVSIGLPVVRIASRRVTFFPRDRWTYRLKYGRTCDAVIAVSENIRELSVKAGVPRERITVIPDGIDIPAELPDPSERLRVRASWNCRDGDFAVGMLGASTPEKGVDVAIAALGLLTQRLPQARLILAGDGPLPMMVKEDSPRCLHLGPVDNLGDFFPGLDLFVMPSRAEGLGSAALLAMSYGLPVVATCVGGLPEVVVENETGWLIPPGSSTALADAILLASRDREKLLAFGRNGRNRAEGFSAAIMVRRTEALYHSLLDAQRHSI